MSGCVIARFTPSPTNLYHVSISGIIVNRAVIAAPLITSIDATPKIMNPMIARHMTNSMDFMTFSQR